MPKGRKKDLTHIKLFNETSDDLKRAFCAGDLDLDDLLPFEIGNTCRHRLAHMLETWGAEHGVSA